jgi:ferredoxin
MRIEIKRDLCIGAASCIAVAGDVFELDDDMKAIVKNPKGATEETILEAARACPTLAIYLYDDDGKQVFPLPPADATPVV